MHREHRGMSGDAWVRDAERDARWEEQAEYVCPMPLGGQRPGDPHRAFHQDLPSRSDVELELEKQRTLFRACLERDRPNLWWLLGRIEHIRGEQARRAAAHAPPVAAGVAQHQRHEDAQRERERERELERRHHEEWLRWHAARGHQVIGRVGEDLWDEEGVG